MNGDNNIFGWIGNFIHYRQHKRIASDLRRLYTLICTDTRRAVCPYCGHQISRWHYLKNGRRSCESCGKSIRNRPASEAELNLFAAPLAIGLLYIFIGWATSFWSIWPGVAVIVLDQVVLLWLWPYLAEFEPTSREVVLPKCPRCFYDLRSTPDRCPECGLVLCEKTSPAQPAITQSPAAPSASPSGRGR